MPLFHKQIEVYPNVHQPMAGLAITAKVLGPDGVELDMAENSVFDLRMCHTYVYPPPPGPPSTQPNDGDKRKEDKARARKQPMSSWSRRSLAPRMQLKFDDDHDSHKNSDVEATSVVTSAVSALSKADEHDEETTDQGDDHNDDAAPTSMQASGREREDNDDDVQEDDFDHAFQSIMLSSFQSVHDHQEEEDDDHEDDDHNKNNKAAGAIDLTLVASSCSDRENDNNDSSYYHKRRKTTTITKDNHQGNNIKSTTTQVDEDCSVLLPFSSSSPPSSPILRPKRRMRGHAGIRRRVVVEEEESDNDTDAMKRQSTEMDHHNEDDHKPEEPPEAVCFWVGHGRFGFLVDYAMLLEFLDGHHILASIAQTKKERQNKEKGRKNTTSSHSRIVVKTNHNHHDHDNDHSDIVIMAVDGGGIITMPRPLRILHVELDPRLSHFDSPRYMPFMLNMMNVWCTTIKRRTDPDAHGSLSPLPHDDTSHESRTMIQPLPISRQFNSSRVTDLVQLELLCNHAFGGTALFRDPLVRFNSEDQTKVRLALLPPIILYMVQPRTGEKRGRTSSSSSHSATAGQGKMSTFLPRVESKSMLHVLEYAAKFLCHDALFVKLVDAALHGTHEHMEGERFTYADFQEHFLGAQKMCQKAAKVASKKLLQDFLDRLRCNKLKDCPETEEYVKLECEQTQRAHSMAWLLNLVDYDQHDDDVDSGSGSNDHHDDKTTFTKKKKKYHDDGGTTNNNDGHVELMFRQYRGDRHYVKEKRRKIAELRTLDRKVKDAFRRAKEASALAPSYSPLYVDLIMSTERAEWIEKHFVFAQKSDGDGGINEEDHTADVRQVLSLESAIRLFAKYHIHQIQQDHKHIGNNNNNNATTRDKKRILPWCQKFPVLCFFEDLSVEMLRKCKLTEVSRATDFRIDVRYIPVPPRARAKNSKSAGGVDASKKAGGVSASSKKAEAEPRAVGHELYVRLRESNTKVNGSAMTPSEYRNWLMHDSHTMTWLNF